MSEAMNPYAAPRAAVADVYEDSEGTQSVKWFSAKGRVGRLRYLARSLVGYLLVIVGGGVVGVIAGLTGAASYAGVLGFLVAVPYLVFFYMLTVQRSHDMGWNGWTALLAIIPFVGLIWIFKGGTPGSNRYGAPPPPNTLMVKIGGLMFPIIMFIGIIAAVALPAYQDYVKRAKASQVGSP